MKQLRLTKSIVWTTLLGISYLILMSALRLVFIYHFNTPETANLSLKSAFILGVRYDLRYVAIIMLITYILSSIKPLNPFENRMGKQILFGIWIFFTVSLLFFYTADFMHFSYLRQRLNASVLTYLDNLAISTQMMWQSYPVIKILLGTGVILLMFYKFIQITFNLVDKRENPTIKNKKWIPGLVFFFILAYSIVGRVVYSGGQYPLRWSDAYSLGSDYSANISLNPIQSFFSTLDFRANKIDIKKIKDNYTLMSDYLFIPNDQRDAENLNFKRVVTPVANDTISPKIQNVVLVICESFSAYKSSLMGNPLNSTPYFNEMRKQGVFFNRAFSPSYGTARGVWAVLTGTPDVQASRTSSRNPSAVDQHSIFSDFKKHDKFYFLGGSTSWANIRGVLTNNITDLTIFEQGKYKAREVDVWGISDKNLFVEANKTLSTKKDPFFAIIQTADNHRPYTIPAEDLGDFKKSNVAIDSLKKYGFESNEELSAFRYADYCIEQFIESAKKEKYFKHTLFVFIGDHGIKGDASNLLPKIFTEQNLTYMHVPLLFFAPGILDSKEYSTPVSQIDVLPSIASLCNIRYTNTTMGRNVFEVIKKAPQKSVFLYDDFKQQVGMFSNEHYYNYQLKHPETHYFESTIKNNKTNSSEQEANMKKLTETMYETSKFMLINNHKAK